MDAVEEIKARLNVDDVVGDYVQLKSAGVNFKGLCPFHNEKTPSFTVSPEKGIYHCFGCGEGGDIFTFIEKIEGLDFRGSLELLARKAGVDLPESGRTTETKDHKLRLYAALDAAAQYYHIQLGRSEVARDYVGKSRGYTPETIKRFKLGWAPSDGTRLVAFLTSNDYTNQELVDSGLARKHGSQLSDMFRGRVMVPFFDAQGRIIGFTGRVLGDSLPKYLNTPSTAIFDKSRFIFGLYQAKESIRKQNEVVVVEGNLDVISSSQAGISYIVAASGTALTAMQLKSLQRLSGNVTLAFDADSAGLKATERAIPLSQTTGVSLYVAKLPKGLDPDDVIKQNPQEWQTILANKIYALDWLIDTLAGNYELKTVQGKTALTSRLGATLKGLKDPVEQEHYVDKLAQMTRIAPATIMRKLANASIAANKPLKTRKSTPVDSVSPGEFETVLQALLSLCVSYADTRAALNDIKIEQANLPSALEVIKYLRSSDKDIAQDKMPKRLQIHANYVKILLLRGEQLYDSWAPLDRQVEAFSLVHRLSNLQTKRYKQNLSLEIAKAEQTGDIERKKKLLQEFKNL